jgi:hypothetical protein
VNDEVKAEGLGLSQRPLARLDQNEEPGCTGGEAGGGGGLGTVTDLLLRQAQASRAGAQGDDDYDVLADSEVVGHAVDVDAGLLAGPYGLTIANHLIRLTPPGG